MNISFTSVLFFKGFLNVWSQFRYKQRVNLTSCQIQLWDKHNRESRCAIDFDPGSRIRIVTIKKGSKFLQQWEQQQLSLFLQLFYCSKLTTTLKTEKHWLFVCGMRKVITPQIYLDVKKLCEEYFVIYKIFQAPLLSTNQCHHINNKSTFDCSYYNQKFRALRETKEKEYKKRKMLNSMMNNKTGKKSIMTNE